MDAKQLSTQQYLNQVARLHNQPLWLQDFNSFANKAYTEIIKKQ